MLVNNDDWNFKTFKIDEDEWFHFLLSVYKNKAAGL